MAFSCQISPFGLNDSGSTLAETNLSSDFGDINFSPEFTGSYGDAQDLPLSTSTNYAESTTYKSEVDNAQTTDLTPEESGNNPGPYDDSSVGDGSAEIPASKIDPVIAATGALLATTNVMSLQSPGIVANSLCVALPGGPDLGNYRIGVIPHSAGQVSHSNTSNTLAPIPSPAAAAPPPPAHMTINLIWDSSVSNAPDPVAFKAAMNAAAQYLDDLIATPITVNILVGWGEENNGATPVKGFVAVGDPLAGINVTYSQLKLDLAANATSVADAAAINSLPVNDPTSGGTFFISAAQAKAWNLMPANGNEIDGAIGFSPAFAFTYDPNHRSVLNEIDIIGAAEHELTHVLGRNADFPPDAYTPLDLFRYSAPGTLQLVGGKPAYFSIDAGQTGQNIPFDTLGDYGDWASTVFGDSFGYGYFDVTLAVSKTDITEMDVLGFKVTSSAVSSVATSGTGITNGNGNLVAGAVVTLTVTMSDVVTIAGGTPSLTLDNGGSAVYDVAHSTSTALAFSYKAAPGQATPDLAVTACNLNGATITDVAGDNADLTGVISTPSGTLQIDMTSPTVIGTSGNDTFAAGGGDRMFNGNGGHDTVVLDGASSGYSIVANGDGSFTIADSVSGRDGTDQITGVEFLQFADKTGFIERGDNASIARLYSAALGRAPDPAGLSSWEDAYASDISVATKAAGVYVALAETVLTGGSISIAGGFTQSAEFQQRYGVISDADFVAQLYENVLGRGPDSAGLGSWLSALAHGSTREMVLVGFSESPENIAKAAIDWLISA